jgi:hypothetical protein
MSANEPQTLRNEYSQTTKVLDDDQFTLAKNFSLNFDHSSFFPVKFSTLMTLISLILNLRIMYKLQMTTKL